MMSCYLLMGRRVRGQVDVLSYVSWVYGVAAMLLIVIAALSRDDVLHYRPATYLYFILLAVVPQLIGHGCLNFALGHATATVVAICILGEPIGASIIAYAFLKESITSLQAIGGALILSGIFVSMRRKSLT